MKHSIHHIHFVGIGGSGMCGIAEVLHNLGYKVSGSDLADSATLARLRTLGVATHVGLAAAHIAGADAVVTSTAVQQHHPEVLAAIEDAIGRIQACGKAAGILTGDETLAKRYVELGCLFVAVGADQNVLRDGAQALVQRFKA